ncbi:uncharacterized mitochondrial protein AtMg00810-like [Miscanthus floridulus]|uniref:uncharacterized mitochondrial protein AtMg00810-like n=1 Tax=Miscanthus floridulus TaxID=154761 RepID=UPI003458E901
MKKAFDMSDLGLLCFYLGVEVRQDASGIALRQTHYAKLILELSGMMGCNKAQMKKAFDMSDLGLLCFYLGVEVRQDASGIALRQTHYAKHILELGGMMGCNPAHTPMEEWLKLSWDSTAEEVNTTYYWRLIRSLRYLVHTRPDLAFAIRYVSLFMERPTMEHLQDVKRILRYVVGTLDYGLHYGRAPNKARFVGYCDSDLADDVDTSKSTIGTMFFLDDCLVGWQSLKQKGVALSSCETEYIATTTIATQALWLSRMLAELLGRKVDVVELKVDNKSALALAKNPIFHERSKHIRIKYHFIRDCLEDGSIKASHIATTDQLADILTKSLGKTKFQEMRERIGLQQITCILLCCNLLFRLLSLVDAIHIKTPFVLFQWMGMNALIVYVLAASCL